MKHEPHGLPAGEVARLLDVPQNTMSTHLAVLARAGLISAERQSRSIIYRAEIDKVREIASFLVNDCCGGRPELCEPLVAEFTPCCSPRGGKQCLLLIASTTSSSSAPATPPARSWPRPC